jgi:ABC-type anion transport system duplicated permease subunit
MIFLFIGGVVSLILTILGGIRCQQQPNKVIDTIASIGQNGGLLPRPFAFPLLCVLLVVFMYNGILFVIYLDCKKEKPISPDQ